MTTTGDKKTYQEVDLSINADRGICPEIRWHVRKKFKEDEGLSDLTNLFREHDWGGEAFSRRVGKYKCQYKDEKRLLKFPFCSVVFQFSARVPKVHGNSRLQNQSPERGFPALVSHSTNWIIHKVEPRSRVTLHQGTAGTLVQPATPG